MSNRTLTTRVSDLEEAVLKLMDEQCPHRIKQSIIPFIFGMMIGGIGMTLLPSACSTRTAIEQKTTFEQQAALGGAAIPFPSGKPSPNVLNVLPKDSKAEPADCSLTNTSEPPLPSSLQADDGQKESTRFFRRLGRPTQ